MGKRLYAGRGNKSTQNDRLHRRGGYTLAELMVVLAILLILAGTLGAGSVRWYSRLVVQRQSSRARTLFLAAQSGLAEYEKNGLLKRFEAQLTAEAGEEEGVVLLADETTLYQTLRLSDGTEALLEEIWQDAGQTEENSTGGTGRGTIISVLLTAEDYQRYADGEEVGAARKAVYDLLSLAAADASVLNAAICVELSVEAQMIYSVFYSDVCEGFDYLDSGRTTGTVSINSRSTADLQARRIGYYGVETLTGSAA